MQRGILHKLSRGLADFLEKGIRQGRGYVPVLLGHPLDVLEERADPEEERATGVLYLYRITPDARFRQNVCVEPAREPGAKDRLRHPQLWIRARYAFLMVGGTPEDELGVLACVLELLHENALLAAEELAAPPSPADPGETGNELGVKAVPVEIVEEPQAWRELGLGEHRLVVSFDVSVPLGPSRSEEVGKILERDLEFDGLDREEGRIS